LPAVVKQLHIVTAYLMVAVCYYKKCKWWPGKK